MKKNRVFSPDHRQMTRKNLAFFAALLLLAAGFTVAFSHSLQEAALVSSGKVSGEDGLWFSGGVTAWPLAQNYAWGLYIASLAVMGVLAWGISRLKAKPEKLFLLLALPMGMLYLLMMVPLAGPDEQVHYQASYQLSNFFIFHWGSPGQGTKAHFDYNQLCGHYNPASGYDRIIREFFAPAERMADSKLPFSYTLTYPLMYVPQAIGIGLARLLGGNFMRVFFAGRVTNFLFYTACVYLAIREVPRYKLLFMLLGLMPMSLHQATTYSYDTFINALALMWIALVLKAAAGQGIMSRKEKVVLLFVAVLLAPAKPVYYPLLLLALLIPSRRYAGIKDQIISLGCLWALALAAVLAFQAGTMGSMTDAGNYVNWEGEANYTLTDALADPVNTLRIFVRTIRFNWQDYFYQALGSVMAGLTVALPIRYIQAYLVLLLLCVLNRAEDDHRITLAARGLYLVSGAGVALLVLVSMFLLWTSNTQQMIQGVQGRYFIPALPLLFLCLDNQTLKLHRDVTRFTLFSALAVHMLIISRVLQLALMT